MTACVTELRIRACSLGSKSRIRCPLKSCLAPVNLKKKIKRQKYPSLPPAPSVSEAEAIAVNFRAS